jgi:peptide/nickel transport system substrate-binding protein
MPEWIGFNVEAAPFDDVLVRRAVGYSLDMDTMLAALFLGVGIRSTQPVAPAVFGFDDTIEPIPYDPDMARSLLAQAGWEDTDGDGVVEKDGQPFNVEFKLMPVPSIQRFGESIQGYMADAGMGSSIVVLDWGAYLGALASGNMQMYILGLANPLGDADMSLHALFHSSGIGVHNYTRYNNPEMDRLIEEERRETDPEKRLALLKEAINLAVDDAVYVPTFVRENLMAHHQNVKGFVLHPSDTFLNLETIYIEE